MWIVRQAASAAIQGVIMAGEMFRVVLADGRSVSAPLAWHPRLQHATAAERNHWRLIADGEGIHWPDLDEDISVENLLAGKRSGESTRSLQRWLDARDH